MGITFQLKKKNYKTRLVRVFQLSKNPKEGDSEKKEIGGLFLIFSLETLRTNRKVVVQQTILGLTQGWQIRVGKLGHRDGVEGWLALFVNRGSVQARGELVRQRRAERNVLLRLFLPLLLFALHFTMGTRNVPERSEFAACVFSPPA